MSEDPDPYLTLQEVCRQLQISRETGYRWIKNGKLRGARIGRGWRFSAASLSSALRESEPGDHRAGHLMADLFSGAGGLSFGFELEGFQSVFFNDFDA